MMRALAVAAILACAGCASAPPPARPVPEEEQWAMLSEPDIPAPAPPAAGVQAPARCAVKMPPKPLWPLDDPALRSKDLYAKASAALIEIELRRAYEAKLEAALRACTQTAVR